MARDKSKGKRAGVGGPKPKVSKQWQTQASSFLVRHFSAEPLEEPPPDDDTTPAPTTEAVPTEAGGSVTSTPIPQSSDTSRGPCRAANSDSDSEEQLPLSARLTTRTPTERPVPTEHSTTVAPPAWLAELHGKLDSMHARLRWLAKTRFPVEKQAGLARNLGMSSPQLSAFLNKKLHG